MKHFFVRRFGLAGKVVILDEVHSYDVYTGTLITELIRQLLALRCSVIVLSATLTRARRAELLAAAGGSSVTSLSQNYPLLTTLTRDSEILETGIESGNSRELKLRVESFSEAELFDECIERAEHGQHVLYLRNTVVEAQETCRRIRGCVRAERVEVGLLHSRFPFFRRQELEVYWLTRLGRERAKDGKGSILIATQVVEQSVDIDLDFIATDLAPTDMLLQRMGRLWRHDRDDRIPIQPEFWINAPLIDGGMSARETERALGKTARVYAPYVLVRTAEVFRTRTSLALPRDIRAVLEQTYAEREDVEETDGCRELRAKLEVQRDEHAALASSATRVFGQQSQDDLEGKLTRLRGAPTRDVILLRSCEMIGKDRWSIAGLEPGESCETSAFEWKIAVARLLHRNLVRVPRHLVPEQVAPRWLTLHTNGPTAWAVVQADGTCEFPDATGPSGCAYDVALGLHSRPGFTPPTYTDDDDEFDD